MEQVLFYLFAFVAVATALYVVAARNPIHSALSLIGTFFALAGTYVLLGAHLLAVLQILVYAGAIMMLFVFVIMLLNLNDEDFGETRTTPMKIAGAGALAVGGLVLGWRVLRGAGDDVPAHLAGGIASLPGFGTTEAVGRALYGPYLLPFEVTSLLLLVAIVAAVVIAKAKI